ncbi:hypothetical protein [Bombella apis]|uniref:Uncharacterized protein n=1 Tax=Bombella apis TaxID=1785988 RepID=A0ABR9MMZ4_9PROT|nr:hypothetical protein [Bombella apis]MBE1723231.1 hypothetical protein [Bombella apis]MBR9731038.1 hypothetical protein [Bombella apis]
MTRYLAMIASRHVVLGVGDLGGNIEIDASRHRAGCHGLCLEDRVIMRSLYLRD